VFSTFHLLFNKNKREKKIGETQGQGEKTREEIAVNKNADSLQLSYPKRSRIPSVS